MKIVYLLKDPLTSFPFYVGKGDKKRPYEHFELVRSGKKATSKRLTSFLKKMLNENREPLIEIVGKDLSNSEALLLETSLIQKFGRVDYEDHGILLNHRLKQTDWTGKKHSEKSKAKMSANRKGRALSEEHKLKIGYAGRGRKLPPRSEQWKQKQRESHIGRKDSVETIERKKAAHTGSKNPRAKMWIIEKENGQKFEVIALKTWCRDLNLSFDNLCRTKITGLFYQNLRVVA